MDSMIERVARAIFKATHGGVWESARVAQPVCEAAARAAIEAMREPTEAMVKAAHRAWSEWEGDGDEHIGETAVDVIWRAMIDAALAEKPE